LRKDYLAILKKWTIAPFVDGHSAISSSLGGGCEEGRDSAWSHGGPGRWHGLPLHARNRIALKCGNVEGHPGAHSVVAKRAILGHFQQA